MKRHGDLFRHIVDMDNLRLAHRNARRGKAHYEAVQTVNANEDEYLHELQESLIAKTFHTSDYRTRTIHEPKKRLIYILPYYPDRIVQHAAMNILQPIWDAMFIHDSYSGIPGKGIHTALDRLSGFLKDVEDTRYCLQFDVKSYYPSVNHDVLLNLLEHKIKCKDTLRLLEDVVRSVDGNKGIPIGNYLSQYFANLYLNRFDHWLKQQKRIKCYIRYNDDGVILHGSKAFLHGLWEEIGQYLDERLKLRLNPKTQIYPVEARGIDFLGYRTFRDYRLLRKSSAKRFKLKMRRIVSGSEDLSPQHIVSSVMSYVGWLQYADCYHLIQKWILDNRPLVRVLDEKCRELGFDNPIRRQYANIAFYT